MGEREKNMPKIKAKYIICILLIAVCFLSALYISGNYSSNNLPIQISSSANQDENIANAAQSIIILNHDGIENSPIDKAAKIFKNSVENMSEGKIFVDIYTANQLGNKLDTEYALRYGTVDLYMGEALYNVMPILEWGAVSNTDDYDIFWQREDIKKLIYEEIEENNIKLLGILCSQTPIISSIKPIQTIEDLYNINVATTQAQANTIFWDIMDSSCVQSERAQIYTAVQRGIVDATVDIFNEEITGKIAAHHRYFMDFPYRVYTKVIYINQDFYKNLDKDTKHIIDESVSKTNEYFSEYILNTKSAMTDILEKNNDEFIQISTQLKDDINSVVREEIINYLEEEHSSYQVERILQYT